MLPKFEIILLAEAYDFIESQPLKVRKKILQNLRRSQYQLNPVLLKKVRGEIWEFRTRFSGMQYRLLAFWDKSDKSRSLVVATHGFVKKANRIRQQEFDKALMLREVYFKEEKE